MSDRARAALVATDRLYFSSGAVDARLPGATLSCVPGLAHLGAGCVIHSVQPEDVVDAPRWLAAAAAAVREQGGCRLRIYVDRPGRDLRAALLEAGLTPREEVAYVARAATADPEPEGVALHHIDPDDGAGWEEVARVHREGGIGSGVHPAPPDEWTELMRRRCRPGVMDGHLVTLDGEACGSVGTLVADGLLRSKNLLVGKAFRRRAVGRAVLARLSSTAVTLGCTEVGAFAVTGSDGARLYPAVGLRAVGRQVEWSGPLPGAAP